MSSYVTGFYYAGVCVWGGGVAVGVKRSMTYLVYCDDLEFILFIYSIYIAHYSQINML